MASKSQQRVARPDDRTTKGLKESERWPQAWTPKINDRLLPMSARHVYIVASVRVCCWTQRWPEELAGVCRVEAEEERTNVGTTATTTTACYRETPVWV